MRRKLDVALVAPTATQRILGMSTLLLGSDAGQDRQHGEQCHRGNEHQCSGFHGFLLFIVFARKCSTCSRRCVTLSSLVLRGRECDTAAPIAYAKQSSQWVSHEVESPGIW